MRVRGTFTFILILTIISLVLFSSGVSAAELIYDDFSGSSLDTSKWTIEPVRDVPFAKGYPDEYYIDSVNKTYHTSQISPGNRQLIISINRQMMPGEILEYDVYYWSGSGNRIANIFINSNGLSDLVANQYSCHHCGALGYWDQEMSIGNDFGLYHYRLEFTETGVNVEVTRPDSSVWNREVTGLNPPYKYEFETRSGHNGVFHIDYDNFRIIDENSSQEGPPECNCSDLEKRIEDLESRVGVLESIVNSIQISIDSLNNTINGFISEVFGYMKNTFYFSRKSMICGYMKDNDLTEHSALGLDCRLAESPYRRYPYRATQAKCNCVENLPAP